MSELTGESYASKGSGSHNFTNVYDLVGNPTTLRSTSGLSYNADNQRSITGTSYDGNGNPSKSTTNAVLTFDAEDRLTQIGTSETNTYFSDGLRASSSTASGTTFFLYDDVTGMPVCDLGPNGNVKSTNTWGVNGLVSRTSGSSSYFHMYDEQGSVSQVLDASGNNVETTGYDAYGGSLSGLTNTLAADPYAGYEGQYGYYRDVAQMYVLGHRFYDPSLARFINRDPIGYAGGIGLYDYTTNAPLDLVDPSGYTGVGSFGWGEFEGLFNSATDNTLFSILNHGCDLLPVGSDPDEQDGAWFADTESTVVQFLDGAGELRALTKVRNVKEMAAVIKCAIKGGCFAAGTPVQMADGTTKPIEQLKAGDVVVSREEATWKTEPERVTTTISHAQMPTLTLTFDDGQQITTTAPHPFYVEGKGFTPAWELAVGDAVETGAGSTASVTSIDSGPRTDVFNLTVAGDHTYFVGDVDGGVWVHNAKICDFHLIDENIPKAKQVAQMMRERGWNARTVAEQFGASGMDDDDMIPNLDDTYGDGWKVITRDVQDWPAANTIPIEGGNETRTAEQVIEQLESLGF